MDFVLAEKRSRTKLIILIGLVLVTAFGGAWYFRYRLDYAPVNQNIPVSINDVFYDSPIKLHSFALTDHNDFLFGISRFHNKWTFLFFGYTHCPDICPATLSQLVLLKKSLASALNHNDPIELQFLLVSVDPERDSIKHLSDYMGYFDRSFMAATGTPEQIEIIEKQLDLFHRFGRASSSGEYSVNHSAEIFLVGPQARVVAKFTPPLNLPRTTAQVVEIVQYYTGPVDAND